MPSYQVLGLPRNPLGVALKDVLTLGIFGKFWLVRINRELDGHERFHLRFVRLWILVILPLVTPLVVKWQTLHRLDKALRHQVTLAPPNPKVLWLVSLVPILGTLTYVAWTQSLLNRHWLWHKRDERIEAKTVRIAELRPHAGETRVRTKIATLEGEVRDLEAQREKELAAAESRRRVRDEKAAERAARPKRSLIPVKLGRRKKTPDAEAESEQEAAEPEPTAEGKPARKLGLPFLRRKKAEPGPEATARAETADVEAAAAGDLSPREQKKLDKQRAKEEAKRAKFEAKAAKEQAKADAKAAQRAAKEAKKAEARGEQAPPVPPPLSPAATPKTPPKAPTPEPAPAATGSASASRGGASATATATTTTAPPTQLPSGGPATKTIKVLTLRCPRCQTRIEGIRKVAGEATSVECPRCHFAATV